MDDNTGNARTTNLEDTVSAALKDCPQQTVFLVAVSGGADSMAMLAALCAVVSKKALFCLHVEHGLRPAHESCADADYVRDFCNKEKVNCRVVSITPGKIESFARQKGIGIEAAARHFRRKAMFRHAARLGADARILIAHTKDDALELSLMRVLRGAGPAGLSLMPQNRGRILRPLLSLNRAEIISYLTEKKIPWREDLTNADEKYLRNRIRRRLIPLLDEYFSTWKQGLTGMAKTQKFTADFLAEEVKKRILWEQSGKGFETCAKNFFSQPQIIREEALFCGINLFLGVTPKRSVIRRFCDGSLKAVDLGKIHVKNKDGKVQAASKKKDFSEKGAVLLIKEPGNYTFNEISIKIKMSKGLSQSENESGFFAALPLVFRRCFKDDYLYNSGKKLSGRNLAKGSFSAVDKFGTAAFVNSKGLLAERERDTASENETGGFYYITVNEGKKNV